MIVSKFYLAVLLYGRAPEISHVKLSGNRNPEKVGFNSTFSRDQTDMKTVERRNQSLSAK